MPLLVVAEDIQWLDPATVAVLTFVGDRGVWAMTYSRA